MHAPDDQSRTVGRYTVYGPIASGGMATVHLGRLRGPAGFSRTVAIKCPHPHYAKDPEFAAMFLDEARLAGRVNHPNVVPMLDVVMTEEDLFLVMDYVHGASLAHAMRTLEARHEQLRVAIVSSIVCDMLRGLHAAHEAKGETGESLNIVHRDVSPQNVLVGLDGVARLLDFGVAKAVGRLQTTRDGKIKGKLSYMAPEQISGKRLTRRADVYSASVVLWETLTGRRLFGNPSGAPREPLVSEVVSKVLFERVPAPSEFVPSLPPEIDRLVMRGLEREPAKRFATALEMAEELHRCAPPAAPGEVGAWLRSVAGEEIEHAVARITNIERFEAETVAVPASSEAPATTTAVEYETTVKTAGVEYETTVKTAGAEYETTVKSAGVKSATTKAGAELETRVDVRRRAVAETPEAFVSPASPPREPEAAPPTPTASKTLATPAPDKPLKKRAAVALTLVGAGAVLIAGVLGARACGTPPPPAATPPAAHSVP